MRDEKKVNPYLVLQFILIVGMSFFGINVMKAIGLPRKTSFSLPSLSLPSLSKRFTVTAPAFLRKSSSQPLTRTTSSPQLPIPQQGASLRRVASAPQLSMQAPAEWTPPPSIIGERVSRFKVEPVQKRTAATASTAYEASVQSPQTFTTRAVAEPEIARVQSREFQGSWAPTEHFESMGQTPAFSTVRFRGTTQAQAERGPEVAEVGFGRARAQVERGEEFGHTALVRKQVQTERGPEVATTSAARFVSAVPELKKKPSEMSDEEILQHLAAEEAAVSHMTAAGRQAQIDTQKSLQARQTREQRGTLWQTGRKADFLEDRAQARAAYGQLPEVQADRARFQQLQQGARERLSAGLPKKSLKEEFNLNQLSPEKRQKAEQEIARQKALDEQQNRERAIQEAEMIRLMQQENQRAADRAVMQEGAQEAIARHRAEITEIDGR